ncbi:HNH endonuclease [Pedobacter sp. UC225_65]|uniref:HNH endonuclease n=1 Tax=Pedobacter sp. UC225_65 TaxID=3350173 RepID=UPI00366FD9EC
MQYHDIHSCRNCNKSWYTKINQCCRNPWQVVTIHWKDGKSSLYNQCINCFGADKTKPLKQIEFSEQIRYPFNQERFEEWKIAKRNEANETYEGTQHSNYQNSEHYRYRQYLLSDEWKVKRKLVFERDSNTCQFCLVVPAVDVHHLHYKNKYDEPLEDLRSTCTHCHWLIHGKNSQAVNP